MNVSSNSGSPARGWNRLTVMHADRKVVSVRGNGSCTFYAKSFLPYDLYLEEADPEDLDARIRNLSNLYHWCSSRVLSPGRRNAKEIMNSIGARQAVTDRDRTATAVFFHALSLTDVFWIKKDQERIRFRDISLYRYPLAGAFAGVSLGGRQLAAQDAERIAPPEAAGDVGTHGTAPKAWIREDGDYFLLKGGDVRDVRAELLASQIAGCFRMDTILYEPYVFRGKEVTKCRNLTTEDRSIVSIGSIDEYCRNHGLDREELVLKKDPYSFYMMNILDYLVGNTDRHRENWGFTVDNRTNRIGKLFPLMDLNRSFCSYESEDGAECLTTGRRISQKEAALEAVKKIGLNQIREIDPELFEDDETGKMFFRRLELLKEADGRRRSSVQPAQAEIKEKR